MGRPVVKTNGIRGPQGPPGTGTGSGTVVSIVGGANVSVDNTDPAHPIVSASGVGGGSDFAVDTHAANSKAAPADADEFPLVDSAASFGKKKWNWGQIKTALGSWIDGRGVAKLKTAFHINGVAVDGTTDVTVSTATPDYVWRMVSGAYPALPSSKPTGTLCVVARGPIDPLQLGGTVPAWVSPPTCDFSYEPTPV